MPPSNEEILRAQANVFLESRELLDKFNETASLFRFFAEHLDPRDFETFRSAALLDEDKQSEESREALLSILRSYEQFRDKILELANNDPETFEAFVARLDHPDNFEDKKIAEEIFDVLRAREQHPDE